MQTFQFPGFKSILKDEAKSEKLFHLIKRDENNNYVRASDTYLKFYKITRLYSDHLNAIICNWKWNLEICYRVKSKLKIILLNYTAPIGTRTLLYFYGHISNILLSQNHLKALEVFSKTEKQIQNTFKR